MEKTTKITEVQYEFALQRIEELLPLVTDETPITDPLAVELDLMSDIVEEYDSVYFPIDTLSPGELIKFGLKEQKLSQRELASELGISTSRMSDFVNGKSELTLSLASKICKILKIEPDLILGF